MKRKEHGADMDPAKKKNKWGLLYQEEQFCHGYLMHFSLTKAAQLAGYPNPGTAGHLLMKKAKIRARIAGIRQEMGKSLDLTREALMQELMKIVYTDSRGLFDANGDLKAPHDWDDDTASTVDTIEIDSLVGGIKKVGRQSKLKAIEMLSKMLGFNAPEVTLSKNINFAAEPMSREDVKEIARMLEENL